MALIIDPTLPANVENLNLGASRIRNLTAALLQMFGFSGTTAETLSVAPVSSVNLTTGQMLLPTKLTLGADGSGSLDAVTVEQSPLSGTAGGGYWFKFPNGLILQILNNYGATAGANITWPIAFSGTSTYAVVLTPVTTSNTVYVQLQAATFFTIGVNGGSTASINIIAVGT